MYIGSATLQDLTQAKALWVDNFDDGSQGFCDFAFTLCSVENIYVIKNDDILISMCMAIDVNINNQKGSYLYSACTHKNYRNQGYMTKLINFIYESRLSKGDKFCVLQPANDNLFAYYKNLGFETAVKLRKCNIEIKKNIWAVADFDIVTASRFMQLREKYKNEEIIHFTSKGYEKLAEYVYTWGGSTAESKNAYCVYYIKDNTAIIVEMLSTHSNYAMELLQAIREKTGVEKAMVYLSEQSNLFLGEGKYVEHCLIKGVNAQVYANLMFD